MFLYGDPLNMTGSEAQASTPSWEFYDLQKDPKENHNAYQDKAYTEGHPTIEKRDASVETRNRRYRRTIETNA